MEYQITVAVKLKKTVDINKASANIIELSQFPR